MEVKILNVNFSNILTVQICHILLLIDKTSLILLLFTQIFESPAVFFGFGNI